ncbi:MAG: dihydroneopterin aldolase [Pseudomonadota bacterium]
MDTVFIRSLTVSTVIGVYSWEREIRQQLVFDLELASDNQQAAADDRIEDAIDYAAISNRVIAFAESNHFRLIETMAEQVAALILKEFSVPWLRLSLAKPGAVAQAESVGVIIERGQHP